MVHLVEYLAKFPFIIESLNPPLSDAHEYIGCSEIHIFRHVREDDFQSDRINIRAEVTFIFPVG